MSEILQSGQHPDADQLSAFVEHALPPHEQQQTLDHLAVCLECRTVVALSLSPLEELPEVQLAPVRRSRFSRWNLALPAAAAFAALAVVIHFRNAATVKRDVTPTQVAVSRQPETLPASPVSSIPAPSPKKQLPSSQRSSGGALTSLNNNTVVDSQSLATLPIENRSVANLKEHRPAVSKELALHGSMGSAAGRAMGGPQMHGGSELNHLQQNASGAAIVSPATPPSSAIPSPAMAFRQEAAAAAPYAPNAAATASTSQVVDVTDANPVVTLSSANSSLLLDETKSALVQHPLPSRLPALSVVSANRRMLAIDTQNTLFLSGDEGLHWKPVSAQWQGRAIKIDLAATSSEGHGEAIGGTESLDSISRFSAPAAPRASAVSPPPAPSAHASAANSSVVGTVTDPSGAIIPDASVVVRDSTTLSTRTAKTDRTGHFLVDGLLPGSYQVEVEARGFSKQQLAVTLAASQQNLANIILSVGHAAETVSVEAAAPLLQPSAKKTTPEPQLAAQTLPVFVITTDSGGTWTSVDGLTWKHK